MKNVLCLVLGGGRGSRLYPLTLRRSEPAVPIAGKYRLIDIPVSNCLNSEIKRVYVLTQFLSASLHRHIANTFKFDAFSQGFVEVLAAQQTNEGTDWYRGTADAVRKQIRYIQADPGDLILILYGDQLYRMDYRELVERHRDSKADATLAVVPVAASAAPNFGIVRVNDEDRVTQVVEKPQTPTALEPLRTPAKWLQEKGCGPATKPFLANMGIYLFSRTFLLDLLEAEPPVVDIVQDVLPQIVKSSRVFAHLHRDYWDDLGTVRSYYEANLALLQDNPPFDFHAAKGVIYTRARNLPAARFSGAKAERSGVCDGCLVERGATLVNSLLGVRSIIGPNVSIRDSLILGAHRFESSQEIEANDKQGIPPMGIGAGTVIERAIVDKDCRIGRNVRIVNERNLTDFDGDNYVIRDGIIVLPDSSVFPDGATI